MDVESVEDLAEELADWCGIYGGCESDGENDCGFDRDRPFCCRMAFVSVMRDRIQASVRNDERKQSKELLEWVSNTSK